MVHQNGNAEKLLQVGVHLMAKNGYQATSTRAIVEAAGVTKPMLYYYYGSKEGLCKAGIRRFSDHFFTELREVLGATEDSRELLVEYIWTIFKYMRDHEDEGLFYMSLFFGPERQWFLNDIKEVLADGHELTMALIEKLIGAGVLRPGCEEEFARTVRGMVDVWRWAAITEGITLSRVIAERIVDNLLNGFGRR
ncbi:MAG: TetR/AcrR family transcriptional regulator [Pirellulales bacterium]|nr:TetR/AcrR family transcriptional regulator [Pirellulales bacterium]